MDLIAILEARCGQLRQMGDDAIQERAAELEQLLQDIRGELKQASSITESGGSVDWEEVRRQSPLHLPHSRGSE